MIEQLKGVLSLGADEDRVCELFNLTHLSLRQLVKRNNLTLDFSIVSESMLDEIVEQTLLYEQIMNRYGLSFAISHSIANGTYELPKRQVPIDHITLQSLLQQGMSVGDIASRLSSSSYYIKKAMKKYNLSSEAQRKKLTEAQYDEIANILIEGQVPSKDIARLYNISPSMVSHIRNDTLIDKPPRKPRKHVEPSLVIRLIDKGCTQQEVAQQLGVSQSSVSRVVACRSL